jgi:hypothetical protein
MLNILRTEGEEKRYRGRRTKRMREVFEKKEAEGNEEEKYKFDWSHPAVLYQYLKAIDYNYSYYMDIWITIVNIMGSHYVHILYI